MKTEQQRTDLITLKEAAKQETRNKHNLKKRKSYAQKKIQPVVKPPHPSPPLPSPPSPPLPLLPPRCSAARSTPTPARGCCPPSYFISHS
jgi:hypothetical protein